MKTIKIKEEFKIPGTDYILEEGDQIGVLSEQESIALGPKVVRIISSGFSDATRAAGARIGPSFYSVKKFKENKATAAGDMLEDGFSLRVSWDFEIEFFPRERDSMGGKSIGTFLLVTTYGGLNDTDTRFTAVSNHYDEAGKLLVANQSIEGDFFKVNR